MTKPESKTALKWMDAASALTKNEAVLQWMEEMAAMTQPDKIVWITGEEEQLEALRKQAVEEGILIKLNEYKLPGCYLHRTDPDDVARVEDRTFICCEREEDAGPTNHWMDPKEMYEKMYALADGAYKGRTMYVIPYSMSIIGSPFAKYGFELTDSIYVVLNMAIMTRIGKAVCDALGDDTGFIKGLHCQCNLDKENKYIVHFPQDNTIISMNSNYGGNVLQGKKCFALRIASNLGRQEGWMAEHMLILGIQNPRGEIKYISAAFPSACGKTNLAMLIPPEGLQRWGWRVWCVGDDIAWLRIGKDGRLWAVNPENGFFGVAPGTSMKSNPNALISTHKDTIFTNVALDLSDNTVWWEGLNKTPPARAIDWRGRPWTPQSPEKAAHPNSRFTAPARNCPCLSPEFDNPEGVPISAIIFGGRRAKTAPRPPPPRPVRSASCAATPWRCCPSAATTWATTGSTGWIWARRSRTRPRSSTSTGSAPTTRVTSPGPASATICACCSGSSPARTMRSARRRPRWATSPTPTTSTWKALKCPCTICAACSPSTVTFGCRSAPTPAPTTRRSARCPRSSTRSLTPLRCVSTAATRESNTEKHNKGRCPLGSVLLSLA